MGMRAVQPEATLACQLQDAVSATGMAASHARITLLTETSISAPRKLLGISSFLEIVPNLGNEIIWSLDTFASIGRTRRDNNIVV